MCVSPQGYFKVAKKIYEGLVKEARMTL
jgi:hypothetical protein